MWQAFKAVFLFFFFFFKAVFLKGNECTFLLFSLPTVWNVDNNELTLRLETNC